MPIGSLQMDDCTFAWESIKAAEYNFNNLRN